MSKVTSHSASHANSYEIISRNPVARIEHVPVSTCSPAASSPKQTDGAVASATAGFGVGVEPLGENFSPVQTDRKSATNSTEEAGRGDDSRRLRFDLKRQAGALYRKHVSIYKNPFDMCMSQYLGYVDGGKIATHATLVHDKTHGKAYVRNVHQCNNAWACPVCSEKNSREREQEILELESYCSKNGYFMAMATLTVRHTRKDKLAVLIENMLLSVRAFWSGSWATKFKKNWGFVGHVRALEVTYSDKNGFHPHLHYLLILKKRPSDTQLEHLQEIFFDRWSEVCKKKGQHVSPSGFCLEPADRGTYVSKWGISAELTKHHYKSEGQTMNMWALLASSEDNSEHGQKWIEFMHAVRGRAQVLWSPGLKKLVEDFIDQQQQLTPADEAKPPETEELDIPARFIRSLLNLYDKTWLGVFEHVEEHGLGRIRQWLQAEYDAELARLCDDDDISF